MRLKVAVSAEADTSWVYSDHAIDVAAAPGLATALIARDAEALALRREVLRAIHDSGVAGDEEKDVQVVVVNSMAHLAEPVLRRGWREAALLTPAELTAAHKGAVEALVVDGESKRVRSHAMHAASALRHRAYQGVAGEPGAQRGGGVAESRMVILADSVEYAQSHGPG